jgi:hypothetical protein
MANRIGRLIAKFEVIDGMMEFVGLQIIPLDDCQNENQAIAQTPDEADEILDRWQHG